MEERERIVSGEPESEQERQFEWSLRPRTLDEYIGQNQLVERIRIGIQAARNREEPLEHVLFHGPPGLGKTTLANIIASEMNGNITVTSGPALSRPGDLMGLLTRLEDNDVLFIDEIHRLPTAVEEFLYPAMEDFRVDFIVEKGPYSKTLKIGLKRFTLVGATTRAGSLTQPLRNRFGFFFHIDFYPEEELADIVRRSASILEVPVEAQAPGMIAGRSRGTPRISNRLLRRVRDYAEVKANGVIDPDSTIKALKMEGIDEQGLDDLDRQMLHTIIEFYDGGPVGIEALSATLNEETDTLVDMVEPYMLKIGFISRTPSGRKATLKAYEHLKKIKPE
jgi:holliday junction DNA helicase RuvB